MIECTPPINSFDLIEKLNIEQQCKDARAALNLTEEHFNDCMHDVFELFKHNRDEEIYEHIIDDMVNIKYFSLELANAEIFDMTPGYDQTEIKFPAFEDYLDAQNIPAQRGKTITLKSRKHKKR